MAHGGVQEGLGPECTKYGISRSELLGGTSEFSVGVKVTNQLILELSRLKDATPSASYGQLMDWLRKIYSSRWPAENPPTVQAVTKSIERLKAKNSKLKKIRDVTKRELEMADFLQEEYSLPRLGFNRGKVCQFALPKPIDTASKSSLAKPDSDLKQKQYAITRNANKRRRRQEALIREQKKTIKEHERKLNHATAQLSILRRKVNTVNHRAMYWKKQTEEIRKSNSTQNKQLREEIKELKEKANSLDLELSDAIESTLKDTKITTFEGGRYNDDVRACVYELLSLNVGVRNISPIIRCVLSSLAHKSIDRLPSYGLTCQMIYESLAIVQAQLGEKLSETPGHTTLQSDGTTKYGQHYVAFDVQDETSTTYSLGLRQVFSGSAKDTLETLKEILDDIDAVQLKLGKEAVSSKIVTKIKNTMSDRHSAEKAFNELLHDFRADILPSVAENWDELSNEEKEQLTRMNNFFCGLHFLVGLADSAEEALKQWEAQTIESANSVSTSGTQRLIRTACKGFHHRGSQQAGCASSFRTYLRRQSIHKIPLAPFIGNRFNILFYDAAGVYYLKHHMIDYIESAHGQQANRLLQAILADLKEPVYVSGCRALGLIEKAVTGPLWRKLEQCDVSIVDLGDYYTRMQAKFTCWSTDSQAFIEGTACIDDDVPIHKDEVWNVLVESNENNTMTLEALQIVFSSFCITTQRLLIDHLPGGIHSRELVEPGVQEEVKSVPTTNVAPECEFAMLDRFMREKPNAKAIALESIILYSHNKTSKWLEKKDSSEKEKLIQAARTLAPAIREKFKERRKVIETRSTAALQRKQDELLRKSRKAIKEKEVLTKEIEKTHLWTSRADIETGLAQCSRQCDKLNALKLQLKFRDKVLGSQTHSNKSLFRFSHKGKQYTVNQLVENLCQLLGETTNESESTSTEASTPDPRNLVDTPPSLELIVLEPELLIGKRIKHRFVVDKKLVWYNGRVTNRNKDSGLFEVIYDEDDEAYEFELLEDIANGDLLLITD